MQPKADVEAPPYDEAAPSDQSPDSFTSANGRSNGADSKCDSKSFPCDGSVPDGTVNNQVTKLSKREVSGFPRVATVHRGTLRRAAKREGRKSDRSREVETTASEEHSAVSLGTVNTTNSSYLSPGAVSIEGNVSSLGDFIDEIFDEESADDCTAEVELGTEDRNDHNPSLLVRARLVYDDLEVVPAFLERRIQEYIESQFRAHHPPVTTTADRINVAEAVVEKVTLSSNPANHKETPNNHSVSGLYPKTFGLFICVAIVVLLLGGVITGIIIKSAPLEPEVNSPSVAPSASVPPPSAAPTQLAPSVM